jgi:hypothetical protein
VKENIFKPTIGNESLYQDTNDNGVRIVKFAPTKHLIVKSTTFPHRKIQKYTCTYINGKIHNQIGHMLIDRRWNSSMLDIRSLSGIGCLVVAKFREILAVNNEATLKFRVERFNLRKLNELEVKKEYKIYTRWQLWIT